MSKLFDHPQALANTVQRIAIKAGEITLDYFDEGGVSCAEEKADGSPVTEADRKAEDYIITALKEITPDVPVIGEETYASLGKIDLSGNDYFWLVDALDGTREFVAGGDEYTVNIALIHQGVPVMGIVYAPAKGELYAGHAELGALRWLEDTDNQKVIRTRAVPRGGYTVVISKYRPYGNNLEELLIDHKVEKTIRRSSSLKICDVARGKADLYPGIGPTCEWDLAAGHAILLAAGGDIFGMDGRSLTYGHADRNFINPDFIVAKEFPFIV